MTKKFQGSLEPPLGSLVYRKSYTDATSDASASRSLVAQTSTESCTTGGLAVEEPADDSDGVDGTTSPPVAETTLEMESETGPGTEVALNPMIDSTVTLVSNSESDTGRDPSLLRSDTTLEDVNNQLDSPIKKTSKKRFESGTTSIPGKQLH